MGLTIGNVSLNLLLDSVRCVRDVIKLVVVGIVPYIKFDCKSINSSEDSNTISVGSVPCRQALFGVMLVQPELHVIPCQFK